MRTLAVAFVITVSAGGCRATETQQPPPRKLDARGVPLDLRADEVLRNPDGTCSFTPSVTCPPPEEATCNPPAPIPVHCPGAAAASAPKPEAVASAPKPEAAASAPKPEATAAATPSAEPATAATSIGSATMDADGTIVLQLRAEGPDAVGDALLRYAKDHPEYAKVLQHLGGLKPGESKPVPPWPD